MIREIGKHAVDPEREKALVFLRRIPAVLWRQDACITSKRIRMHDEPLRMRMTNDVGRHEIFPRTDSFRESGDLGQTRFGQEISVGAAIARQH